MGQSRKDAETKVAWITGGLALAGTVTAAVLATGVFNRPETGSTSPPPTSPTTVQSLRRRSLRHLLCRPGSKDIG